MDGASRQPGASLQGAKIVARYLSGRIIKGYTFDFQPARSHFHVFSDHSASSRPTMVLVKELKAVFVVRDFEGNREYAERKEFERAQPTGGPARRAALTFLDGEVLVGTMEEGDPGSPYFVLIPADPRSNNVRVHAVASATRSVRFLTGAPTVPRAPLTFRRQTRVPLPPRVSSWLLRPQPARSA